MKRDPLTTVLRRRFNRDLTWPRAEPALAAKLAAAPIVAVAIDLAEGPAPVNDALRVAAGRILATLPSARLACLNVLKHGRITLDTTLDEHGHNKHIDRLVALRHWAEPLKLEDHRLTVHVLEAIDPASAILEFAQANRVDHIVIGARQSSLLRTLLGSVSGQSRGRGSLHRDRRPPLPPGRSGRTAIARAGVPRHRAGRAAGELLMRDDSLPSRPLSQPQSHLLAMTNTRPGRTPPRGFTRTPLRNGPLTRCVRNRGQAARNSKG